MQWISKTYTSGKKILLSSDKQQVVLQVRYQVATEEDVITPSFRVAVSMTLTETIALATSLLNVASAQLDQLQVASVDQGQEVGNYGSEAETPSPWQ